MTTWFWMLYTPIMLVFALILKLNGNTIMGWELYILLGVLFPFQYRARIQHMSKKIQICAWIFLIVMNVLFVYLSWPTAPAAV